MAHEFDLAVGVGSVREFYAQGERPTTEKGSAAAEAIDEPTLALGRPPQAAGTDHRRRDAQLARRRRRRQVLVESGRLRSGAAAIGERGDLHDLLPPGHRDVEQIAGTHYPRRLGRLLVEVDLPAVAGPRGERTALEEARGPQPLVEAHLGHDVCTVARSLGYTRGRTGRLPPRGSASWRRPPRMRDSTRRARGSWRQAAEPTQWRTDAKRLAAVAARARNRLVAVGAGGEAGGGGLV